MEATEDAVIAVADLARRGVAPQTIDLPAHRKLLVTSDRVNVQDVTDHEMVDAHGLIVPKPARIKQGVVLQTVDSLVDYVNRFKTDTTVLFADIEKNRIVALIDYHGPEAADHVDHRASMDLPFSFEWATWTGMHDRRMPQLDFARFIEENAAEVKAPSGADLLEVVHDLQAVRKVDFRKAVRTNSDNESFEYVDETNAAGKSGEIEIPTRFMLELPVYFGHRAVELAAFLRWKLEEGALMLGFALHRSEHVRQAVFREIVLDVGERTDRPVVFGRTERLPYQS